MRFVLVVALLPAVLGGAAAIGLSEPARAQSDCISASDQFQVFGDADLGVETVTIDNNCTHDVRCWVSIGGGGTTVVDTSPGRSGGAMRQGVPPGTPYSYRCQYSQF